MQKALSNLSIKRYFNLFYNRMKYNFMNKFFLLILITLAAAPSVFAQQKQQVEQTFIVKDASKLYDVKIKIGNCESNDVCYEAATVYLMKKNQTQAFQTFEMPEMYLGLSTDKTLDGKPLELKRGEIYGFGFADYNFDGVLDLTLSNGYNRPYGGISNDVFLFDRKKNKFVKHEALSEIETENVSVEINKKQRIIEAMTKSGCCFHKTARYRMVNNRLVKFYVQTEEWVESGAEITTERLVGKRWKKTFKIKRMN